MKCHLQVRCVVATCLIVCAASGVGAPEAVGQMHPGQATKGTGTLTSSVVEVPMDTSTRQPLIEVKIDGKGPFKFVFDTGAGFNAVDDDLVKQLALESFGTAEAGDGSGKPMRTVSIVQLGTVSFGGASFADQRAVVIDFDEPYRSDDRPDGIIGLGTTAEFLTTFDYPKQKLILTRGSLPPADDMDILSYNLGYGVPALTLMVAGREESVAIDTGSSSGCVLKKSLEGKVPMKSALVLVGVARRANSEAKIRQARINGPLVLGRHVVDSPIASFGGVHSFIGYDVLRNFAITFDAQAQTVRFSREGRGPISIPPRYSAGFGTDQANGVRTVAFVLEGSAAKKAGLRVDDTIITVNGRPGGSYGRAEWRNVWRTPGDRQLRIRRNDNPLEITVPVVLKVP